MSDSRGYGYARERAGSVARAMLSGNACPDRTLAAADRVFSDTIKLATGERTAKPATAASMTRAIRESDLAVRYADRREVTGALARLTMRVKRASGGIVADRPGPIAPDACAGRMDQARGAACRDLTDAIHAFRSGRNGAAKDAARGKIRAILHTWEGDAIVSGAATLAGWTL